VAWYDLGDGYGVRVRWCWEMAWTEAVRGLGLKVEVEGADHDRLREPLLAALWEHSLDPHDWLRERWAT
jgi:hypothetical protein